MRTIATASLMRGTVRAKRMPCQPSTTCGPLAPSPNVKRPPDIEFRLRAVIPSIAGVREASWRIPVPRRIFEVRAAR